MVHIQNATLAGGVAIGTSANMMVSPVGALTVGVLAGIISTLGYQKLQPILLEKLHIHDTCGVHNLHGMPGVLAALASLVFGKINEIQDKPIMVQQLTGHHGSEYAAYVQGAALAITLSLSLAGGAFTGLVLKGLEKLLKKMESKYVSESDTGHEYHDTAWVDHTHTEK